MVIRLVLLAATVSAFAPQQQTKGRMAFALQRATVTNSDSIHPINQELQESKLATDKDEEDKAKAAFLSDLQASQEVTQQDGFGTPNPSNNTDLAVVNAVLKMSEQAAVEAEASLPDDIFEKLEIQSDRLEETTLLNKSPPVEPETPKNDAVVELEAPKVSKILKFAVPAIGVWLCGPLLSLIDTSTVGLFAGTTHQAALNPAVAVTDYAALLIAFLYTATTNLIAAARETDRGTPNMPQTTKTLVGAIQLSTYVGAGLGMVLFVFAKPLLRAIIGNDSISPAVFATAMKYVRIRALGVPAAAAVGSLQAACLGMQDIRSPLYVLGVAAVVNLVGDLVLVGNTHQWIGGAAGAAWATTISQYAALGMFLRWLCTKSRRKTQVNVSDAIMELTGSGGSSSAGRRRQRFLQKLQDLLHVEKSTLPVHEKAFVTPQTTAARIDEKNKDRSFSVRGFLRDRFRPRDLFQKPSDETIADFKEYVLPVTSTQVGRVSGYVAMSHVVSSSMGTLNMAAQQVLVSLFYCLCPIADSLSLTAQSFLPAINEKPASKARTAALGKTALNFAKAGAIFSSVMVAAVSTIPLLSRFFTADAQVASIVSGVTPLLIGFFGVHGIVCAMEGILLGRKDLQFLGRMYAAYFLCVPYFMLRVKRAALAGVKGIHLNSVWKVFVGYQLVRFVTWSLRVFLVQRRTESTSVSP